MEYSSRRGFAYLFERLYVSKSWKRAYKGFDSEIRKIHNFILWKKI